MSIADHFDRAPDLGFVRSYDARAARRQFQVSVALIVILMSAAFTLVLLIRSAPPAGPAHPAPSVHDSRFA